MSAAPLRGVFCAAATPLRADGTPDHALFAAHARALLEEGCHGIALLGSTGEAVSLSLRERMALLEAAVAAGVPPAALLPGTAVPSVADTVALTRHAVAAGARAAVLLPPFYYKAVTDEGLFRYYARVIEGVGDARLRVILYHIPMLTGVPLSHDLIARLLDAFPGVVVGIKDSDGRLANMEAMAARFPGFAVLAGADPLMLPLLRAGGAGCITATSNLVARDLRAVFDGWDDPARAAAVEAAQARIDAWRTLTNAYVQLPTVKAMIAERRGDEGWLRVHPPFVPLDPAARAAVRAEMARLDTL